VAVLTVAGQLWDAARMLQTEGGWTAPGWPWLTADRRGISACACPWAHGSGGVWSAAPLAGRARISVDEILIQKTSSIVQAQLDLFVSFSAPGQAQWEFLTNVSKKQPYSCPNPYNYLGTAHPNPAAIRNGTLTIGGEAPRRAVIANFVARRMAKTAADTLGLEGRSPGPLVANLLSSIAEINLCWSRDAPLAFNGAYATAALPAIGVYRGTRTSVHITRSDQSGHAAVHATSPGLL
jgi:hypothetical protein